MSGAVTPTSRAIRSTRSCACSGPKSRPPASPNFCRPFAASATHCGWRNDGQDVGRTQAHHLVLGSSAGCAGAIRLPYVDCAGSLADEGCRRETRAESSGDENRARGRRRDGPPRAPARAFRIRRGGSGRRPIQIRDRRGLLVPGANEPFFPVSLMAVQTEYRTMSWRGRAFRVFTKPIEYQGETYATLVATPLEDVRAVIRD